MTEQERSDEIQNRFNSMSDARLAFNSIYPSIHNMNKFIKELQDSEDQENTETILQSLESKDNE